MHKWKEHGMIHARALRRAFVVYILNAWNTMSAPALGRQNKVLTCLETIVG
ncbi:hypothetical protein [Halobacillus naozhouensis]|uniref:Uncharacterized protein n=1 Tax=Halobacillus naozhouensis TaxID=554880 RepID=A0ABY8J6E2_9BACI|nr:hypothetical protein [Halobacillus naozhouensis]WFT76526.1 hypothetical protein P9989_09250 [Halobacillus naozhouensis]